MSERAESTDTPFWTDANGDEALHRYRTLVNTIDDGIYQLDADSRFVAVNDVLVGMTGRAREELQRHGGEIWVDSEPGEGSTFSFTVPVPGESDE